MRWFVFLIHRDITISACDVVLGLVVVREREELFVFSEEDGCNVCVFTLSCFLA